MSMQHCAACERKVDSKRHIGVGTLLLVLVTVGFWLPIIFFYRQRCPICKSAEFVQPKRSRKDKKIDRVASITLRTIVVVMAALLIPLLILGIAESISLSL